MNAIGLNDLAAPSSAGSVAGSTSFGYLYSKYLVVGAYFKVEFVPRAANPV